MPEHEPHIEDRPAGRCIVLVHVGSYDGLIDANSTLQD